MLTSVDASPLNYLLYVPEHYQKTQPLPVILYLHGSGERGDNPLLVTRYGLPRNLKNTNTFPFIVLMPQCPADMRWTPLLDAAAGCGAADAG